MVIARKEETQISHAPIAPATAKLSLAYVWVAYVAFGLAALAGMLQGMVRGGIIELPSWTNYYQILTAHGVLMALIFTCCHQTFDPARSRFQRNRHHGKRRGRQHQGGQFQFQGIFTNYRGNDSADSKPSQGVRGGECQNNNPPWLGNQERFPRTSRTRYPCFFCSNWSSQDATGDSS